MPDRANPERLIVVGVLSGAHGVRGDVRVKSYTDDPDAIFTLGPLLSDKGETLLEAKSAKPGNDHFIVTPKTVRQKEDWDALKGTRLHVRRSTLPPPAEDEFYIEDLVGLAVMDTEGEPVGRIKSVQNFGAGDLIEVLPDAPGKPAYFVPFTLHDVPEVSFARGMVSLLDPAGWADQSDPRESGD